MPNRQATKLDSSEEVATRKQGELTPSELAKWNGGRPAPFFQKGQSGNPHGRPSKKPIQKAYMRILGMSRTELASYKPTTGIEKVAWAMIQRAWNVKDAHMVSAVREITDRVDGRPALADEDREAISSSTMSSEERLARIAILVEKVK